MIKAPLAKATNRQPDALIGALNPPRSCQTACARQGRYPEANLGAGRQELAAADGGTCRHSASVHFGAVVRS